MQLCVSQEINTVPYTFKTTGIRVFTFEEVLYHVYHYWKESIEDFLSDELIEWVTERASARLAAQMKDLAGLESFSEQMLGFFALHTYLDEGEINTLATVLDSWGKRYEWEKLKERGDVMVNRGDPAGAIPLYKRAAAYDENPALFNNLGLAYLQTGRAIEGFNSLDRALKLAPENFNILLHYIEGAILSGNLGKASQAIKFAEDSRPGTADIYFLTGLLLWEQKNYLAAMENITKAREINGVDFYVYKAVDFFVTMRMYERARQTLEDANERDSTYYAKEAEIFFASGDTAGAIHSAEKAVSLTENDNAALLTRLASYYRQGYDTVKAEEAINKALVADPHSDTARLENARIQKARGKTREYRANLTDILRSFKDKYRDNLM